MIPAKEVGGDFYDFFFIDEYRLGLVIGDVAGKGIPAAIFMAMTRALIKATALRGGPGSNCIQTVNRILYLESMPNMFVTVFSAFSTPKQAILNTAMQATTRH